MRSTRDAEMDAYDKLPAEVRAALGECKNSISAVGTLKLLKKHSPTEVIATIRATDNLPDDALPKRRRASPSRVTVSTYWELQSGAFQSFSAVYRSPKLQAQLVEKRRFKATVTRLRNIGALDEFLSREP
jgi:hypothetical protein